MMRAIDDNGLDEEIRCEMCKNPMHTDRGCDGNCKYDEKLYEKIIQILNKRITPLPSAQPDLSSYSDKLWRNAYERGKAEAEAEIVRCKDCKWKQGAECVRFADVRPWPDDFCSRAERLEG